MTNKTEAKTITIRNNETMTDRKENELYLHIKCNVLNETLIFQLLNVHIYYGIAKTYEELTK